MAKEIDNDKVKVVEVYGTIWHKMSIEPRRVIEQMLKTALRGHRNWVVHEHEPDSFAIWHEIGRNYDEKLCDITKEEYMYIQHLKEIKKYLDKHYD